MPLQTVGLAIAVKQVSGEKSLERQGSIEGGAAVGLGKDQAVACLGFGLARVDGHALEIEHRQDIRQAEAAARMAPAGIGDHLDGKAADLVSSLFQLR
jgi:hypothetical protein